VLAGAGAGGDIGIRRFLRTHRRELRSAKAIVLGIAPCGSGSRGYWRSDGRLIPLGYARPLRALAANSHEVPPHRGRGASPAFPARARGLAAIAIGCLDQGGLAPNSHQPTDTAQAIDETALDQTVEFARQLIDAINVSLARQTATEQPATPA
jgi:hypothetical protein